MVRNRSERGEGQFGCLVGLVFLLIAGLIAYKMVPVKVKSADLRDTVKDYAKSAGQFKDGEIRKAILEKAETLELPVGEENIEIDRKGNEINVAVEYTVPVEFPGYTYEWHFSHKATNPIF
jgi:hypothetical protein